MVNVATPYQRVRFELARDDLHIEWPQSILGVLPVRLLRLQIPLVDLQSIRFTHTVVPTRLVLALGLALLPVVADLPRLLTSFAVVLAVWFLLLSIIGCVEVVHAEERTTVPVCLLQKRSVVGFLARVPRAGGEQERLGT